MSTKKFNSNYYSSKYIDFVRTTQLDDNDFVEATVSRRYDSIQSDEEIQKLFPMMKFPFCNSLKGYVLKKDIPTLKELAKKLSYFVDIKKYMFIYRTIPGGYLYSTLKPGAKTKIKPEDLPDDYIEIHVSGYTDYIKTSSVKDIMYVESPFHNHAFKDDCLYISYNELINRGNMHDIKVCLPVRGRDIVSVLLGIEKNSHIDSKIIQSIKERMVKQYNAYVEESNKYLNLTKIDSFNELI